MAPNAKAHKTQLLGVNHVKVLLALKDHLWVNFSKAEMVNKVIALKVFGNTKQGVLDFTQYKILSNETGYEKFIIRLERLERLEG